MLAFLQNNIGTVLVGIILAAVIAVIVIKMLKDRKKGKSSCGCGCENCPSANMCHKSK